MNKGLVDKEGNWIDFDSIQHTAPSNWGIGMYNIALDMAKHAMKRENYCDYSATQLSVPVRRYWLEHRYDYWITPVQYADRWIGDCIHLGITDERPVCAELDGETIGGTPDLVEGNAIIDYKATSKSTLTKIRRYLIYDVKPEWVEQLNIYKWLMNKNNVAIEKMFDVLILKSCFLGIDEHFHCIEVDELEDVEGLIRERIALIQSHEATPDNALPACKFVPTFGTKIVEASICEHYCDVKEFCTFDDIDDIDDIAF